MKKKWLSILGAGCIFFCVVSATEASLIITDGLVAAYEFSGNANDSSGSGNDATVSNAVLTADRFGNANNAYLFNGVNTFIEKTSPVNLNIGSQNWTIAAWVNQSNNTNADTQMIVNRYELGWAGSTYGNYAAYYHFYLTDGVPGFNLRDDNSNHFRVDGPAIVSDDSWHHIAGVLDSDMDLLSLFVDGSLVNTASLIGLTSITDSGSPLEIGRIFRCDFGSPIYYFDGSIDDVFIYNRALSISEVNSLYTGTSPVPVPSTILFFGSGIMGLAGTRLRRRKA